MTETPMMVSMVASNNYDLTARQIMKHILLASTLLAGLQVAPLIGVAPAYATELNSDTGCDNAGAWMTDVRGGTIAVTGSKCVFTGVTKESMLMQNNAAVKEGGKIILTFTVSGYGGVGELRPFVGWPMMTAAPAGQWVNAITPIDDTFTTTSTLLTGVHPAKISFTGPGGDSSETGGAFRFSGKAAKLGLVDPIVYPGQPNPHMHQFLCAIDVTPNSTYASMRKHGGSSCENRDDNAVSRVAYWHPPMMTERNGKLYFILPELYTIYYKGASTVTSAHVTLAGASISGTTLTVPSVSPDGMLQQNNYLTGAGITAGSTFITGQLTGTAGSSGTYSLNASPGTIGAETITASMYNGPETDVTNECANITPAPHVCRGDPPPGLNVVAGYNFTTGLCGPMDSTHSSGGISCGGPDGFIYDCWDNNGNPLTGTYPSLVALKNSGLCPAAGQGKVHMGINYPMCWDGVHIDSPNHRDHMSYGTGTGTCDVSHPVEIPTISLLIYFTIDDSFYAGKWRLQTDEMSEVTPGGTLHADYKEAWSPYFRGKFAANGVLAHNSLSGGELGDGYSMDTSNIKNDDGTSIGCNGCTTPGPQRFVPTEKLGMGSNITANGTYTVELTAPAGGTWGFMGFDGVTAQIDNISVQTISVGAKGPVTIH